jgi:hypothetical protein
MSFDTQIQQISADDLDKMFDSTPPGTPSAETLIVGSKSSDEVEDDKPLVIGHAKIDHIDLEDIPNIDEVDDKKPEEGAEDDSEDDGKDKTTTEVGVSEVLKNTVEYLINSGQWADFEGREELEITEEVYSDLAAKQNQLAAYDIVNELIDSTGTYGKAIISHIKNGGNPDEIIDIFKAQKEIDQIDTADESGKKVLIEKYYKEILKWKPEKVTKTLNRLIEDDEVDSEFADVQELYDKHHQEQLEKIEVETKAIEADKKKKQEVFTENIKNTINSNPNLTPKEKAVIASSILDFKHNLGNGQKVNDFYLKFAEVQADPESYIELVSFVMDMKGYKNKIQSKEETAASKKVFSFVKGNKAIPKAGSTPLAINDKRETTNTGTNFSFALNKKR